MLHIMERFFTHLFMAAGILLATFFALQTLYRHSKIARFLFPSERFKFLMLTATIVAAGAFTREAYDVYHGQTLLKAIFDYASWLIGLAFSIFAAIRFPKD